MCRSEKWFDPPDIRADIEAIKPDANATTHGVAAAEGAATALAQMSQDLRQLVSHFKFQLFRRCAPRL
jgi:hypothetical protein